LEDVCHKSEGLHGFYKEKKKERYWCLTLQLHPVFVNPRRACAARVTVLGLCVCVCVCVSVCVSVCVCVCLSPLILVLQGPSRLISDTNGSSATRTQKIMWRFCLNGDVREIWR